MANAPRHRGVGRLHRRRVAEPLRGHEKFVFFVVQLVGPDFFPHLDYHESRLRPDTFFLWEGDGKGWCAWNGGLGGSRRADADAPVQHVEEKEGGLVCLEVSRSRGGGGISISRRANTPVQHVEKEA